MEEKKLRLAIVGGGICGLTFAIALSKGAPDIDVDIYEAATRFTEIGAGMGMWPRIWEVMDTLGLSESLRKRTGSQSQAGRLQYRKSDQREGIPLVSSAVNLETYHRADFLQALFEHAPPNYHTHFSKRLSSYTDSSINAATGGSKQEPVTLHFADGTSATCDILVGADGIKSAVRYTMYKKLSALAEARGAPVEEVECLGQNCRASWTGQKCWRALISQKDLEKIDSKHPSLASPVIYTGKHRYLITYSVSHGQFLNVGAFISDPDMKGTTYAEAWQSPSSQSELVAHFKDFETPVQTILRLMVSPSLWAVNTVEGLPTFVSGHVALLGDAAHAMLPHQASGVGQGVEDGMVLTCLLASSFTTRDSINTALQVYDTVRRPFSQDIQHLSFKTGQMAYHETPIFEGESEETAEEIKLESFAKDLEGVYKWTWEGHVAEQQERALALFTKELCT